MSLPHRLRRFLCAQLGNPSLADEAMLDALEIMVARRQPITPIAAFRTAHRVAIRITPAWPAGGEPMRQALGALPPGTRSAFLLLRLERFSYTEAADIMDLSPERVAEEARDAAVTIQKMLVPTGGTALITAHDQLMAVDLGNIAAEVGFHIIREPLPSQSTLVGQPGPILIICEAVDQAGRDTAPAIAELAQLHDAAVLCVTTSDRSDAFLKQVPGAQLLRKPFETATAIRCILDAVAEHRYSSIGARFDRED